MCQSVAEEVRLEIFRRMSPQKKLELAFGLYRSARQLKEAGLRMQHPEWSEAQVKQKTKEIFLGART